MFIWEFSAGSVLDQMMDWLYGMLIGFLSEFLAMMNGMGAELFALPWVEAIVLFFSNLGWMLYAEDWWWPALSVPLSISLAGAVSGMWR